jgi:hypothetical protein
MYDRRLKLGPLAPPALRSSGATETPQVAFKRMRFDEPLFPGFTIFPPFFAIRPRRSVLLPLRILILISIHARRGGRGRY